MTGSVGGFTAAFLAGYAAVWTLLVPWCGLLAAGMMAATASGRAIAQVPVAVVVPLVLCGLLEPLVGVEIPLLRDHWVMIAAGGLVVMGGLVALALALPATVSVLVAGLYGVSQGVVLAEWAGAVAQPLAFWAGIGAGAVLLMTAGVGAASLLPTLLGGPALRVAGGVVALVGVARLFGLV